jgi:hypothetical protein
MLVGSDGRKADRFARPRKEDEHHFKSTHTRSVCVQALNAYGNTVIVAKSAGAVPDDVDAKYIAIRNATAKIE